MSTLSVVYAASRNNVIGRNGSLPWHLGGDMRRFKEITAGGVVVMGRKTFESIGKPLPGRTCIVVSRQLGYRPAGVLTTVSLDEALQLWRVSPELSKKDAFIIGGAELIREGLLRAGIVHLTYVDADVEGDTLVAPIDWRVWAVGAREHYPADESNDFPYRFLRLERRRA